LHALPAFCDGSGPFHRRAAERAFAQAIRASPIELI
jgi:hypothetical protein